LANWQIVTANLQEVILVCTCTQALAYYMSEKNAAEKIKGWHIALYWACLPLGIFIISIIDHQDRELAKNISIGFGFLWVLFPYYSYLFYDGKENLAKNLGCIAKLVGLLVGLVLLGGILPKSCTSDSENEPPVQYYRR
jgi:hypothetical protein